MERQNKRIFATRTLATLDGGTGELPDKDCVQELHRLQCAKILVVCHGAIPVLTPWIPALVGMRQPLFIHPLHGGGLRVDHLVSCSSLPCLWSLAGIRSESGGLMHELCREACTPGRPQHRESKRTPLSRHSGWEGLCGLPGFSRQSSKTMPTERGPPSHVEGDGERRFGRRCIHLWRVTP